MAALDIQPGRHYKDGNEVVWRIVQIRKGSCRWLDPVLAMRAGNDLDLGRSFAHDGTHRLGIPGWSLVEEVPA